VCPHFHMSLQSGDDAVLKRMNRNYDTALFKGRVDRITGLMPLCAITTDVIAGFPGETEGEHENTKKFIAGMPFTRLHVFPYSDRPDTKASKMGDKVADGEKKRRVKELIEAGKKKENAFIELNTGLAREVLTEDGEDSGLLTGYTDNYIKVYFEGDSSLANNLVNVEISGIKDGKAMAALKIENRE
jgi:threonylcarbamoyladenosine tRNA methylthiotransferase MtaB